MQLLFFFACIFFCFPVINTALSYFLFAELAMSVQLIFFKLSRRIVQFLWLNAIAFAWGGGGHSSWRHLLSCSSMEELCSDLLTRSPPRTFHYLLGECHLPLSLKDSLPWIPCLFSSILSCFGSPSTWSFLRKVHKK